MLAPVWEAEHDPGICRPIAHPRSFQGGCVPLNESSVCLLSAPDVSSYQALPEENIGIYRNTEGPSAHPTTERPPFRHAHATPSRPRTKHWSVCWPGQDKVDPQKLVVAPWKVNMELEGECV